MGAKQMIGDKLTGRDPDLCNYPWKRYLPVADSNSRQIKAAQTSVQVWENAEPTFGECYFLFPWQIGSTWLLRCLWQVCFLSRYSCHDAIGEVWWSLPIQLKITLQAYSRAPYNKITIWRYNKMNWYCIHVRTYGQRTSQVHRLSSHFSFSDRS